MTQDTARVLVEEYARRALDARHPLTFVAYLRARILGRIDSGRGADCDEWRELSRLAGAAT